MLLDEFIIKQKQLLDLERAEEVNRSKSLMECSQKLLEEKNLCIRKVSIANIFTGLYGRTIMEFELKSKREELSRRVFSQGDIVAIYLASKVVTSQAIATGLFYKSNKENIQIALDNTVDCNDEIILSETYCLVKLSSEITYSRLKSGLKYLEKRTNPLCGDYLVDLLLGNSKLSETNQEKEVKFFNEKLNSSQKDAVRFALSRSDIAVVHGPPGTGKSTVAVELINQILQSPTSGRSPKVLVCTPSNIALDNLAEKLIMSQPAISAINSNRVNGKINKSKISTKCNLLRLGHSARVMPHLTDISLDSRLSQCDQADLIFQVRSQIDSILNKSSRQSNSFVGRRELSELRKELRDRELKAVREVLTWSNVVMSTLTGLRSNKSTLPLDEIDFDVVLIDEASQAIEAACWLAIPRGKKLILAGDHQQLPPTVLSEEAMKQGLGVSLMERLLDLYPTNEITRLLSCQYRMHENIMRWSSDTFYQSLLQPDPSVAQHTLKDVFVDFDCENPDPIGPLMFLDTVGCDLYELESGQEESKANLGEAQLSAVYIEKLFDRFQLEPNHVGVITPYSRQVQLIKQSIKTRMESRWDGKFDCNLIEVSTVDGFQGREKEVIVISLVRSNPSGTVGFLSEHRRLNVALTRAKRHMCVIGDSGTLEHSNDQVLRSLVDYWNKNADVLSAHDYVYEFDISTGDCVKHQFSKPRSTAGTITEHTRNGNQKKSTKIDMSKEMELEKEVCDRLRKFQLEDQKSIEFPCELSSRIRAALHELAQSLGLQHQSLGKGSKRKLIVRKPEIEIKSSERVLVDNLKPVVEEEFSLHGNSNEPICIEKVFHNDDKKIKETMLEFCIAEHECITEDKNKNGNSVSMETVNQKIEENNEKYITIMDQLSTVVNIDNSQLNRSVFKPTNNVKKFKSEFSEKSYKQSELVKFEKKKLRQPKSAEKVKRDIPEDFDQMVEYFQKLDKTCQFTATRCSTLVSMLGVNCQFCKKRFCLTHAQPEVHLCPLATTAAWRQLDSKPKPSSNSQKIRHAQLSHLLHSKMKSTKSDKR